MLRYAITDRRQHGEDERARRAGLRAWAAGLGAAGVDLVQLREKDLPGRVLAELGRELLAALKEHAPEGGRRTRLLINSRADVAIAVGADGVHLTSAPGQLRPGDIRRLYRSAALEEPFVSVSCHSLADVHRVVPTDSGDRPDLILFGPVYEKRIDEERALQGTGLVLLREACAAAASIPVLALGGVTAATVPDCLDAGAAGIAAIRMFLP